MAADLRERRQASGRPGRREQSDSADLRTDLAVAKGELSAYIKDGVGGLRKRCRQSSGQSARRSAASARASARRSAQLEATLPHFATKADLNDAIHRLESQMIRWFYSRRWASGSLCVHDSEVRELNAPCPTAETSRRPAPIQFHMKRRVAGAGDRSATGRGHTFPLPCQIGSTTTVSDALTWSVLTSYAAASRNFATRERSTDVGRELIDAHLRQKRRRPRRYVFDHRAFTCTGGLGRREWQESEGHLHHSPARRSLFSGLGVLLERFPHARAVATPEVAKGRAYLSSQSIDGFWRKLFPVRFPSSF